MPENNRTHLQLSRFEGMFPGHRTELVEGAIVATPLRPTDNATVQDLWTVLKGQLSDDWGFLSDVAAACATTTRSRTGPMPGAASRTT